jgi:hypothetical protein
MMAEIVIKAIRDEMKIARQRMHPGDLCDYYWGRFTGLALAATLLCRGGGCPDCRAALPADGSCCDACGWVLASSGERGPT